MVGTIIQTAGMCLAAVENGVGVCVLGTCLTAAAVCVGFRLAGYNLGLTCRKSDRVRRNARKKDPLEEASPEDKAALQEYRTAYNQWAIADKLNGAEDYYARAQKLRAEVERKRRERQAFQEERVRELDAIREERKAGKAAAEKVVEDAAEAAKPDGGGVKGGGVKK